MVESARHACVISLAVLLVSLSAGVTSGAVPLVLNELMAANAGTLKDPQDQYDDWIEIHNPSSAPVDAGGLYLTDDPEDPTRWQIPSGNKSLTTILPGGFLLIWADGDTTASGLHAGLKLDADGDALYLFDADGATLIDSVEFRNQIPNVSYGRYPDATGPWHIMNSPTPLMSNAPPSLGVVSNLEFSHERGFYNTPFDLTISCRTPGAAIYYTLDGSEPYLQGGRIPIGIPYAGPIRITRTTCLRAIAVKPDWVPTPMETHSYLFPADVAMQSTQPPGFPTTWGGVSADYQMDPDILSKPQYGGQLQAALMSLPSMSIVMTNTDLFSSQTGIYANPTAMGPGWERPCSIELIYPDGTDGFQINCGARIQGGAFRSASNRKHSFRIVFKGAYGPTKLRYPLFGEDAADEFDTIVLRAGANDGYVWGGNEANVQYTRDQFMRDLQHDTGNAAAHGGFVHLYINGLYWGLYNPCERPDGSFCSSYYGSEKEDWDVFKHKGFALVDQGERTALNQMLALCQEAGKSYEALTRLQGKGLDGTRQAEYPCLLDLANYADYMIVNLWGGNWDWPWNNYWLGRDRTAASTGFKFFCWDAEDVMLTSRSPLHINMLADSKIGNEAGQPHARLKENPEYRMFFADRVHRLFFNDGILTPDALIERYTVMAGSIEKAMIPEAARWADQRGSSVTPANWASMRDRILTTYLPQRTSIVLGQFRTAGLYPSIDAPVFHVNGALRHGGNILSTDRLAMQAGSDIFYTLDGSDPRVPSQTISVGGNAATILIAENAAKRVLVPTGPVDDSWRGSGAFDDTAWISGIGGVGYERSTGYETLFQIDVQNQMYMRNTSCYVRIPFDLGATDPANLTGLTLRVRYDDGFVAWLNGVEVARRNFAGEPAWNSAANAQNSDIDAVNLEDFSLPDARNHLRTGRNLLAIQALNQSSTSSDFLMSVTLVTSAGSSEMPAGTSPTAMRYTGPITLDKSTLVKARALSGGSWSALNEAVFAVGPVAESLRINEIMYHPADDPNAEYVELTNIGAEPINLNLVQFTEGIAYTFPDFTLAPGGYGLLVRDLSAFEARYGSTLAVLGQYAGSLGNGGEKIELSDAAGGIIERFAYKDGWFDLTDGMGFSLTRRDPRADNPDDKSAWRPSAHSGGSPGTDDSGQVPELGAVVINELLANSAGAGPDWIELFNATGQTIDLSGWYLSDDANDLTRYRIAAGTTIPAGGYLVFYEDQHFRNTADPGCQVPFGLSQEGETLYLHSGSAGVLTGYSEEARFGPSGAGVTLGRPCRDAKSCVSTDFVALTEPTPGRANAAPVAEPVTTD